MMYLWGNFPENMIKLRFAEVGSGFANDGFTHEKTVPFVIAAQAITGEYEVASPMGKITASQNEVFLSPSNVPLKITHRSEPHKPTMSFQFIHLEFMLFDTIDIFSVFTLPLKADKDTGQQIGAIIAGLIHLKDISTKKHAINNLLQRNELTSRLLNILLTISRPPDDELINYQIYQSVVPVFTYIKDHLATSITMDDLIPLMPMSRSAFFHFFKKHFRKTPMDYLKSIRLNEAYRLLCYSDRSVSKVAEETGFSNTYHFSREFRKYFHKTPSQARKAHQELMDMRDLT
ncbi:AraC family transcriptional regulator [Paenibacillus psychroresistens]|uniref:AraC family transcriptional regulator n=1 Tax=Paenibacillus psychroresistens TaxID=1778678 RepID=A0A6B8RQV1_9BACL|nr:AraC family transcriptional regulator [Paenibacillus psychroresistens]QGQ97756.1 AraC family transcriptional regulator [Paenibacillus psychroresistens]